MRESVWYENAKCLNMKHFSQTVIHNELFVEDNWGGSSTIYLGDLQKRLC